jgi:hypothetical protein
MAAHPRFRRASALLAAGALAAMLAPPVAAQEGPQLVAIGWNRFVDVSEARHVAYLEGTMTCDRDGTLTGIEMAATQGTAVGRSNEDVNPFECSTEPRRFLVYLENEDGWRRGGAHLEVIHAETVVAAGWFVIRAR